MSFTKFCGARSANLACCGVISLCTASYIFLQWRKHLILQRKAREENKIEKASIDSMLRELETDDVEEREKILSMDSDSLIAAAQDGEIDLVAIVRAYMYKACCSTKTLNNVTGIVKHSIQDSSKLKSKTPKKCLLYGLPVSLKESIQLKGMDSTIGVSRFLGQPASEDAVIVKVLKHCGAVPFVRTNLPQLMQSLGSSNPIYGETGNPFNIKYTPGGSSSGEGSLIGDKGSLLGFGTDIAGSIRNPAHMCGITGLKPTMSRISKVGIRGSLKGQTLVAATVGPMAQDVDTLVRAMRALLCPLMFQLDPWVPPMPFNDEIYTSTRKLRIGYYVTDGFNQAVPSVQRAVLVAKEALEKAGHTLVPFEVPRIADAMRILTSALYADGGKGNLKQLKHCQVEPRNMEEYRKWKCPAGLRWILSAILSLRSPRIGQDLSLYGGGDRSVTRLWNLQAETYQYRKDFLSVWKTRSGCLDALICPPYPVAASPQGSIAEKMTKMMDYTALYNLLDFPGGVVPVTRVNDQDINDLRDYRGHYGDCWDKQIKKASEGSLGMPVGVQCVCLPWQEEMCLRVMKEIETAVGYQ